jgi:hypothetical protein
MSTKAKAKSAKKPPTPKKAKPEVTTPREQKNGVTRPGADTLCGKVWEALDKLKADGKDATFEAVRELAGKGMADATIRTQRQRWNTFNG